MQGARRSLTSLTWWRTGRVSRPNLRQKVVTHHFAVLLPFGMGTEFGHQRGRFADRSFRRRMPLNLPGDTID
jgi:hypothetical protein